MLYQSQKSNDIAIPANQDVQRMNSQRMAINVIERAKEPFFKGKIHFYSPDELLYS